MGQSTRCLALYSGGLDSQLAARLIQRQGIPVELFAFRSVFTCYDHLAATSAEHLGLPLQFLDPGDDYLQLLRTPRFGFGRSANPCIDCRIYMLRCLATKLEPDSCDFIITGEVLGQRGFAQKRRDLEAIAYHAGVEELLLRPLSAQQLAITRPEREGWVNREKLLGFHGASRAPLIELAKKLNISPIPAPTSGCRLTDPAFGAKVFDLTKHGPQSTWWDYQLLRVGRHFRYTSAVRFVVGRNASENDQLASLFADTKHDRGWLIAPANFRGPTVLIVVEDPILPTQAATVAGSDAATLISIGVGLLHRYSRQAADKPRQALVRSFDGEHLHEVQADPQAASLTTLTSAFDPPTAR